MRGGDPVQKGVRPMYATIAIFVMLASGLATVAIGVYFLVVGASVFGVLLVWLLGSIYALGGRALQRGETWGWGAGVFGGVLYWLFGPFLHPIMFAFIALAIVVVVFLFLSREYYGMVRPDPKADERTREQLQAERTANPRGLHCPRCGSTALWIASDGSAFCTACKVGTISLRPDA